MEAFAAFTSIAAAASQATNYGTSSDKTRAGA
jgi:hypothetical protein